MKNQKESRTDSSGSKNLYDASLLAWMENNEFIMAMRQGLKLCIPVLLAGSFCLVFSSFPVPSYQQWLQQVLDGWLLQAILWVHKATIGSVTFYVVLAISYCYGNQRRSGESGFYVITSMVAYIIFVEQDVTELSLSCFDNDWLFVGIFLTLLCCLLLRKFLGLFHRCIKFHSLTGLDMDLRSTVTVIFPFIGVIITVLLIKLVLFQIFGTDIPNVGYYLMKKLFIVVGTALPGAVLFVFLIHILWFFGVHGSNMLGFVSLELFEYGMFFNKLAVSGGREAPQIFTKTFIDVFVLMGGSGATICLLIAMLIQKRKQAKTLFNISVIPAIFNINEVVLFGLPVIFNPIMIIPFTLVPLILMGIAALSMYIGLVPVPFVQVAWTTPVLFSGYLSTGSITGAILQLVLIVVGTLIYMPFLKMFDLYNGKKLQRNIRYLIKELEECESRGEQIDFEKGNREKQEMVKMLLSDLQTAIVNNEIMLYYQPQMNNDETVYGVEALLRWNHPAAGFLYPPLIIELARQNGLLDQLGFIIIEKAAEDLAFLATKLNKQIHMAVNISPAQFDNKEFCKKVFKILNRFDFRDSSLCFEVTEQLSLALTDTVVNNIKELRDAGYSFHMDDFGMGHSSMKYLQNNEFEAVKIDGSLTRELLNNTRSQDIISGMRQMAPALNYELIAEYVETIEQKERLEGLGCFIYQGALYSMAVPRNELEEFLEEYHMMK